MAAYDSTLNKMVIYGGEGLVDTWVLSNANGLGGSSQWTLLAPAGQPPTQISDTRGMYDPQSQRLILFGGLTSSSTKTNETFILINAMGIGSPTWQSLNPPGTLPSPRCCWAGGYDQLGNALIVFGGQSTTFLNDTWVLTSANGLAGTQLSVSQVAPNHGGNAGTATVSLTGAGFQSGAQVKLTGSGADILGTNTQMLDVGYLTTTFNMAGATPGLRNVVVTNPDTTTTTLNAGFTVEQGGAPQISVEIIGRDKIRIGTQQTFYLAITNSGNIDAVGVPIWVQVPSNVNLSIDFSLTDAANALTGVAKSNAQANATIPYQVTIDNSTIAGFYKPYAPAGSSAVLPITLAFNSAIAPFQWNTWVFPPYLASATGTFVATNPTAATKCTVDLASLVLTGGFGVGGVVLDSLASLINFSMDSPSLADVQMSTWQIFADIAKDDGLPVFSAKDVTELSGFGNALGIVSAIQDCAPFANIIFKMMSERPVSSLDPNDKVGAPGVGTGRFIAGQSAVPYSVYFDNQPTATAPAQSVSVADTLSSNLDPNTVTLGPITFPNQVITPPSIPLSIVPFTTTVDLRPTTDLLVKVTASLNPSTATLTEAFQSLDPTTGLPPTDATAGFLPPGAEGSIFFTVLQKSSVSTGSVVQNTATVVFDENAAINTPTWTNIIDNTPPVSHVSALTATSSCPAFRVSWSGSDVGSGLQDFTIYVSDSGAPYTAWISNTTAASTDYLGVSGHTYSFFSIATDLVGNMEGPKTTADASTSVTASGPCGAPSLSGQLSNVVQSGTIVTAMLTLTNTGFTAAQAVNINQITFRTLSGSGTVTLASPTIPAAEGPLAIAASMTVPVTLNVPATVTRFSMTESGNLQDGSGNNYNYSIAQTVIP